MVFKSKFQSSKEKEFGYVVVVMVMLHFLAAMVLALMGDSGSVASIGLSCFLVGLTIFCYYTVRYLGPNANTVQIMLVLMVVCYFWYSQGEVFFSQIAKILKVFI